MEFAYHTDANGVLSLYPHCEVHRYFYQNGTPPIVSGCKDCWNVYYFTQFAQMKVEERQDSVDLLESGIHHLIEANKKGEWDFKPDFSFSIERDAIPDKEN